MIVAQAQLVIRAEIKIQFPDEFQGWSLEFVTLKTRGLVSKVRAQKTAELIQIGSQHPGFGSSHRLATGVCGEICPGLSDFVVFEAAKEKHLILDNRTTQAQTDEAVIKFARGISQISGIITNQPFIAELIVGGAGEFVGTALGNRVDAGADEIALAHVVWSDVDLNLLNRVQGNW